MSDPHPTTVPDDQPDDHPDDHADDSLVSTAADGAYLVTAPVSGARPDVVRMRVDETVYTFGDYDGVQQDSAVLPSVLRYTTCSVHRADDGE